MKYFSYIKRLFHTLKGEEDISLHMNVMYICGKDQDYGDIHKWQESGPLCEAWTVRIKTIIACKYHDN